jgi:hypothetical protein
MTTKTKPLDFGESNGSKTIQKLRRRYYFLSLLQHPFRWLFWAIQQRLDRLELQVLRLTSDQGGKDGN